MTCIGIVTQHTGKRSRNSKYPQDIKVPCKHEYCPRCAKLSLPPRSSDFWICCQAQCHELNLYNSKQRARDIARRVVLRTMACYGQIDDDKVYLAI